MNRYIFSGVLVGDAILTGQKHAEMKSKIKDFGLADACVLAGAEKIKMRTLVRLSKEHLKMPLGLTKTTWYDAIVVKALLESGYFERAPTSAGYLQFSMSAYDLMELGSEASKSRSES